MEVDEEIKGKNDSDTDSSDSDDDALQETAKRAEELEAQISTNKYLYGAHEELVKLYHKLGDLKSMRLAYERFHEHFPLTPALWLDWINVEKALASTDAEVQRIFDLFDLAVADYLSVNLWVEYAQYSIGAATIEKTRAILQRGLQAAGLHTADASLLWDTLRELELAHLQMAPQDADQLAKVVEVFRRQLSVPLIDMANTYAEWQAFLAQFPHVQPEPVEWGYKTATKQLSKYEPHEAQLLQADEAHLLAVYRQYIAEVADPSTILCLYERATAQLCLRPEIWLDYVAYAQKLGDACVAISGKALRNCPWSDRLWVQRLRVLEALARPASEVLAAFEAGAASVDPALAVGLWLAYLEYVRRTGERRTLVALFERALELFTWRRPAENLALARFYARVLATGGEMGEARRVWRELLRSRENKAVASLWLEWAGLERRFGEAGRARAVYERGLAQCGDWPQVVADEWRMYEREEGALADVVRAEGKMEEILRTKPVLAPEKRKAEEAGGRAPKRGNFEAEAPKRGKFEGLGRRQPIVKDPTQTVFVSNLYPSVSEKRLAKVFPGAVNIELVLDRAGKSRCYGYVQFGAEEGVAHALARDRELVDGRPIFVSSCKPDRTERKAAFKYATEVEENKLFVRGLPVGRTQEEVEELFRPMGAVGARLVRHKSGQSKGLAYVEFPNGEAAKKAMEQTDGMDVGGFRITVAISAPPAKEAASSRERTVEVPERRGRSRLQAAMVPRVLQVKPEPVKNGAPKSNDDFRKMLLK